MQNAHAAKAAGQSCKMKKWSWSLIMSRSARHLIVIATFLSVVVSVQVAMAATPALESAYWRFEESVSPGTKVQDGVVDQVLDSINANHMESFIADTSPTYTTDIAPTQLKSGLTNSKALSFDGNDDIYTSVKTIDNGMIKDGVTGFTLEAAFRPSIVSGTFQAIVSKEGKPNADSGNQTLELKIRDNGHLQIEQFDKAGNLPAPQLTTPDALVAGNWYYAAVVNDSSTLSLYLDSVDGNGYQLIGSTPVSGGALYQGPDGDNWGKSWTIGRGQFQESPSDWFNGVIDEVRLTNAPLDPSQFLFAPPDGDFNGDGAKNAADYSTWRKSNVFGDDGYVAWRENFNGDPSSVSGLSAAPVPEPGGIMLALLGLIGIGASRRRKGLKM
jgi:hypothetical protein